MLGLFWRRVTKAGAISGFVLGLSVFIVLHAAVLPTGGPVLDWLRYQAPNPYSCAALAEVVAVLVTVVVSLLTKPLPDNHVATVFGAARP